MKKKVEHYSEELIKSVYDNWQPNGGTVIDLAEHIGIKPWQVSYIANQLRKQGADLPRMTRPKGQTKYAIWKKW